MTNNICTLNQLDLFEKTNLQSSILSYKYDIINPSTEHEKGKLPIHFNFGVSNDEYIDLSNIYFYLKCAIVKKVGNDYLTTDDCGPINNFMHSVIKQAEVSLNKTPLATNTDYPFKAYFENSINFGSDSKNTHLSSEGYFKDTANEFNSTRISSLRSNVKNESNQRNQPEIFNPQSSDSASNSNSGDSSSSSSSVSASNGAPKPNKNDQDLTIDNETELMDESPTPINYAKIIRYVETIDSGINDGYRKRRSLFIGKDGEMFGKLHLDLFSCNKYLPHNIELEVKLKKSDDAFLLLGSKSDEYKVIITEIYFEVKRVQLESAIILAHQSVLEKGNYMRFPFTRVEMKPHLVNSGSKAFSLKDICRSKVCKRLIVGMLKHTSYEGNKLTTPFYFEHFKCSNISITLDGNNIPFQPFEFDFDKDQFLKGYSTLFTGSGNFQNGNDITPYDYKRGYTLLCLDLSRDACPINDHQSLTRNGRIDLTIKFATELLVPINVILYLEYDDEFQIAKYKNIIYEIK